MAKGIRARWDREFPMARLAPHLGELAYTSRDAATCIAGIGRVGDTHNGPALCAFGTGTSRRARGTNLYLCTKFAPRQSGCDQVSAVTN